MAAAVVAEHDEAGITVDVLYGFEDGVAVDEGVDGWGRALGAEVAAGSVRDEEGVIVCVGDNHAPYVASENSWCVVRYM